MTRRGLLAALGGFALDPERLLWRPGAKLISIPALIPSFPPSVRVRCTQGVLEVAWPPGSWTALGPLNLRKALALRMADGPINFPLSLRKTDWARLH